MSIVKASIGKRITCGLENGLHGIRVPDPQMACVPAAHQESFCPGILFAAFSEVVYELLSEGMRHLGEVLCRQNLAVWNDVS